MLNRKQLEDARMCDKCGNCVEECSVFDEERYVQNGFDCEERLAQTALTLLDMLKRLEWPIGGIATNYCPICHGQERFGHSPDCELGNLLKEVEKNNENRN